MSTAQTERARTCDSLLAAGPGAPTLCEGWDAHDLALHLWVRENEPITAGGIVIPALKKRTAARMAELKSILTLAEVVASLRVGPPRLSPFNLPGADNAANTIEYFIHGEDVRRCHPDLPQHPLDDAFQDDLWRRLASMLPLFGRLKLPLVLERSDRPDQTLRVNRGSEIVTLLGRPAELMLFGYGRRSVAEVQVIASPSMRAELERRSLSL